MAEPELCSGHAIEPRSPSSPKYPVEGRSAGADKRIRWRTAVGDPSGGIERILGNADHPIPVGSLGRRVADAKRERERRRAVSTQVQHAAFGIVGARPVALLACA